MRKYTLTKRFRRKRHAAAAVEMAVVLTVFILILFGIVEYCRFIFVRQVMVNAAREGARFAVVNTLATEMESSTKSRVQKYLNTIGNSVSNTDIKVYQGDSSGKFKGPAINAEFGEYVVVEVTGDFRTILPTLLRMSDTFKIRSKAMMYSEAN